jgi:hypothetical protein
MKIKVELGPGDFLDRFAILIVKQTKIGDPYAEECKKYCDLAEPLLQTEIVRGLFDQLVRVHADAFEILETAVPHALNGGMNMAEHAAAIRINRDRVRIRDQIDRAFGCLPTEVKTYYGEKNAV